MAAFLALTVQVPAWESPNFGIGLDQAALAAPKMCS